MNRTSRVTSPLSAILIVLTALCTPVVAHAATVATPTMSPAAGSYTGTQSVTLSDTTSGATIYYTTNGTTPTSSSTKYTGAISVTTSETIKAIAELSGDTNSAVASAAYTITVPTPTMSPAAGSYVGTQSVTISDATSGATCYYTLTAGTTGTTPTTSSTKYTSAVSVTATSVLEALCTLSGDTNSAVASAAYTITVPTPTFSPAAGSYTGTQSVTLSDTTSGATIYYTTNGTTPTSSSTKYTAAISVSTSETIKAIAELSGATNSAVASAAYTITVPTPTFSPGAGTYGGTQSVTISDATSGATCYYTLTAGTTGTTPTTSSTKYSSAVSVTATSVLEALCTFSGDTNSAVATAAYTFVAPTPTFSLVGGSYFGSQTVTISDTNSAATIYYTTNGTTPTTSSTKYTSAITVGTTETLEAIAVVTGYSNSAVATATYTITTTPGTLNIYLSPPAAQTTAVSGAATETFDALAAGTYTTPYVSAAGIGTYTGSSSQPFAITAANEYGGAIDSTSSTPTNYFAVGTESGSENAVYLTLAHPVSYFGFWWSAGDAYNRVALYSGSSLYGTFSTADLLRFLNNGSGTITATNGSNYETSAYFGNPNITSGANDSTEPFAYVSFVVTGATITQIAFYNDSTSTGFESDNHSAIFSGNTVTIPTTFVPVETLTLGSQVVTPVFTPNYAVAPMTVTISTTTAGASINYTTNGTAPTPTTGTVCGIPCTVTVTASETLEAIGYETGLTNSAVASATYTIPTLTVTSSSNPSTYGSSVTFTATISSGPTGTITFYDGGTSIGTGTISGGSATLTTNGLAVGAHSITASWLGNATYGSVLSSAITQTVNAAAPTITFTVPNQTYGVAPFTVSATSNSSGAITYSVVSGPATISGSTVTITGVGTVVLQASQAASGNYAAGTQNASFTVTAEAPTITFNVSNQIYGVAPFTVSATSNSSGAITYSVVSGPATISGSTVTITGVGTVVLKASQAASGNYAAGTQNASFTVTAEAPTISFTVPNQTYGVAPFTVSATSNSSGAITYSVVSGPATISGSTVTITGVGTVVLQASQAASGNYAAGTQNASFTVTAEAPTITFNVSNQTYGVAPFTVSATSNSSGAITYSVVSGPATISGSTVTITGVGTVVLKASQAASGNYAAGTQNASFTVTAEAPTITFNVSNQTYGVAPFTVSATSNSSGAITYSVVSGPATISGSTVTITGVGTVVLQASQAASGNYAAGTQNASFTVTAEAPTITFNVSNQIYGVAPFTASATSNSSGAITYSVVSGPATISGATVTITGVGTVVLQASQAASGNYAAGTQNASFTVTAEAPTITFTVPNQTYGVAPFTVSATSNSSGAITYSVVSGPATISGSTVTITGVGTVVLQASQAASGNYAAGTQNASFTVAIAAQTITFTAPASPVTYGVAPIALSASASSGLAVTFSIVSGPGTVSGSTLTITGPGTVVIAANQSGNADYSAAPQVTQSIVVNSSVSITVAPTNAVLSAGQSQQFTATVTNTGNTAVNWSINPAGVGSISSSGLYTAPATISGQQVVTITATSQADTSATATATVNLAPPCATNGYSYARAITIDHTKVPNTDQINFPFLFNTTDPTLATTANNGHVSSPDGYDIIFTSDPAGQNPLPYEMEQYNPATGQVVAWVQIPDLSHNSDTVIYLFYGNPNVTASQQNPTAVWNANYQAVWHLPNGTTLSANDSTANANNAIIQGSPAAISGEIWGGAQFNSGSYLIPGSYISLSSGNYTLSSWFQTPLPTTNDGWNTLFRGSEDHEVIVHEGDWTLGSYDNTDGTGYNSSGFSVSSLSNGWHYLVAASSGSTLLFYVDGQYVGASSFLSTNDVETIGNYRGDGNQQWGSADEIRVSNSARSADWIATEYANQGFPATFYSLTAENAVEVVPTAVSLLASQSQQFSIPGTCNTSIAWSMPNDAPGTLSSSGLYTAPASITQPQTVTITGQTETENLTSATVTLVPQIWPNGGPAGTVITINGQGFGSAEGPSSVTVGGLAAVTISWSDSQIQVQIPTGTGLGNQAVVVTVGNQAIAQAAFAVTSGLVGITPSGNEIAAATTIGTPSQTAPLIFNGTVGQLVSVQLLNSTFPGWGSPLTFTILNPDGSTLTNQGIYNGSVTNPVTLPATGIYTLVANPQGGTGSANINLWEYSNLTGTITPGVADPVSINIPAQEELLSFNCTAGQILSVQLAGSTFPGWGSPLTFTILNPDGSTLTNQGIYNGSVTNPVTLSQTGMCTLVINPQGGTGSAVVTLWEYGNLTGTTSSGVPNPVSISIPAQEELLSFNCTAGQILSVQLAGSTFPGWGSPLTFTILNPDGSTLTNQGIYNGSVTNPVTLSQTGMCTLVINPQGGTGSAVVTLWEYGNLTGTTSSGVPNPVSISIPAQEELLSFNCTAGQILSVQLAGSTFPGWGSPLTFTILNPDGSTLTNQGIYNGSVTNPVTLSQTGTCTLVINPQGGTGSAVVTLWEYGNLTGTIVPGVPYPLTINIPGQEALLSFGGTAGKIVNVQLSGSTFPGWGSPLTFTILNPDGSTLTNQGIYNGSVTNFVTLPTTGTYTLVVNPQGGTGSATLLLTETVASITVAPPGVSLAGGQTEQFTANVTSSTSNPTIAWTLTPATAAGTISSSGLYTAPATISAQQIVTVTASAATSNGNLSGTAQVKLTPASPTIAVQPLSVTLIGGQTQQYSVSITNLSSAAVTWSMSPTDAGTISASGLYTAPPVVTAQQIVTITAASQLNPAFSASATLTLLPADCVAQSYGYERAIVINHTMVPESDQPNFPFYFAATDPLLATIANGGHMTSANGYDIQFSSDPAGQHSLSYDLEQYNAANGQIIAWVQVPVLSHTQDTVIYMFYGNSAITAPQQNPAGVWDSNYLGVYQFDNLQSGVVLDSTINGNNAIEGGLQQATGTPGGAATFDGAAGFVLLPTNDFASFPVNGSSGTIFNSSFAAWFKTDSAGVILGQTGAGGSGGVPALYIDTTGYLRANFFNLQNAQQIVSPTVFNDNNWHYAVLTFDTNSTQNTIGVGGGVTSTTNGVETLYVDGQVIGSQTGAVPNPYSSAYSYFLGTGYASGSANTPNLNNGWFYFNGSLDEVEVSSIARSSSWLQTEYHNQGSPSTFFVLGSEASATPSVNPGVVTLYQSQSQQFTVLQTGLCNAGDAVWSMPAGSAGTLSPAGLYTAPATIDTRQTVTVTATTLGANSTPLNATVTLMPPVAISLAPGVATLPNGGTQQFTATVANTADNAVTWTLNPVGAGSISSTGLYTAPSTLSGQTVSVIATSQADPTQSASATVTLGQAAAAVPTITINPPSALLYPAQGQQFIATVANTANPAVTWSITPAGVGTIDDTGLYTAPASIAAGQTITITATSEANPSIAASVSVVIVPACASDGYVRQIVINASQVQNSDQANFPFLFNTTDPLLAATAYGGHVSNLNGSDIFFTSDPAGQNPLPYEVEEYNPQTGQMIAWVKIPNLSHTSNTTIYLFYGNPSITSSRQNPTAVWDSNFVGVWHLPNGSVLSANDSTVNGNNGTPGDGVSATAGFIDGGASFSGANSAYINIPSSSSSWNFAGDVTVSAWINTASNGVGIVQAQGGNPLFYLEVGPSTVGGNANVAVAYFRTDSGSVLVANGNKPIDDNNWHYVQAVRSTGNAVNIYVDGILDSTTPYSDNGRIDNSGGAVNIGGFGSSYDLIGTIDEVRVSNVARSADWIATEYINQTSPSTFYSVSAEETQGILPASVTLYPNQSQQFAFPGLCGDISWSLSSGAQGTLTSGGLYTAPSSITEQQTLTVTASSQANPGQPASAIVTLMPPVSVTVSPASITLNANQTQQFTATVNNSLSQAVTWTMSPAGLGSLDQNGGYVAPSSITTQQTVTITATSVTDPTKSASAMITLAPSVCASTGYGYQRVIVIDHTKVPNTDQTNFPFLFNSTDPDLATVDNGGHVANPNGYDIIFSSDPNGQTKLDFEVEQYNPATGQMVAWIRIPTLSHSADTVIYVFYGNPAIAISQANPTGVWDSDYQAVYHLGSLPSTEIATDSTSNANNAPFTNLTPIPGQIDGSAGLDGVTSFLEIPSNAFPSYPTGVYSNLGVNTTWNNTTFSATFGIWFKTTSWGGLLDQTAGDSCLGFFGICLFPSPEQPGTGPYGSWASMLDVNFNGQLEARGVSATTQTYNDNNWHYGVVTFENGVDNLYADGQLVGTGSQGTFGYNPTYAYFVGTEDAEADTSSLDSQPWKYLPGQIDEISVSNTARSGDWIQTQFNNQNSPSTFYKFYAPNAIQVAPSSISLYASQSELFVVPASCDATITWSLTAGSTGTLTSAGLYTAPSAVSSQQTVTVSAVSQSNGASLGSAQVTLLPAPQPLTLVASSPSPYQVGSSQTFTATLLDQQGNPLTGVTVNFTVAGPNETVGSVTTNASGTASFTYTGSNSGTDTLQATASVDGALLTSNSLTATWLAPPPAQAPTLTLLPQTSPGRGALMGAFTDNNGDVIEPIVIGTATRTFITPSGATRLQLGIDDTYYEQNGGAGFVVQVNGVNVTVPPTAMPWNWTTGSLNNNYQYGVSDGSSPVIAASSLIAGQPVTVSYQSGTISTNYPVNPLVDANGENGFVTGTQLFNGTYFPTLYTTGAAYPQNQPINVFATVVDASGAPIPNTPVTLTISGANAGQYQATTDATGTASFLYTGQYAGNDSLQAQATLAGQGGTLESNLTTIDWTNYPTPPPVGSLSLYYIVSIVNDQRFTVLAKDASGNVLPNVSVGCYVTGIESSQTSSSTNNLGEAGCGIYHNQSSSYGIFAVDTVDRNVLVTQPYTGNWTVPTGSPSATGGTITVGISADTTVTMPNSLQLTGTVTDNSGLMPTVAWTQVSGPGTVAFAAPNQASTTATFSQVGTYVLQLSANDTVNSGFAQFTVTVLAPSVASQAQGWIGAPKYGSSVSGVVPITLAPGITVASGTLSYMPTNNPNNVTVLNPNVSGSGQIGTLDATMLANGSYLIQMQATDINGNPQYSLVQVTVTGNYKPGRVTTTITDLVVPATGMAIQIQRTYDSLNAGTSGDFGYGWNLGINVNLSVDPSGNVTFTLGGQRKTFYLTPTIPTGFGGVLFPYYFVAYTPAPGLTGTLSDVGSGCAFDLLEPNGSLWQCYNQGTQFNPTTYVYTDPTGTQYTMSAGGQLQSIADKNGNGLTITPYGITSTTGLNVPFVRDSQNRITQITDPEGNVYLYQYDTNGNLASVTYPNTPQPNTYTYDQNHFYLTGTDFRDNPLPATAYYGAGETDASGNYSVTSKLQSVTDAGGNTTSYTYNLATNTTTITYPPDANGNVGTETMVYDSNGDVLSSTDPLGHTTTNTYDANFNLQSTTDPLGHTTSYTYDANGNKTSTSYPATATSTNTTSTANYNLFSAPTSITDENGNTRTFNYDANYNPQSVTDAVGTLISTQFNNSGQLVSGAIGYDLTQNPARASQLAYDANGNLASRTDALGRTTSFTYNALGQKITMTEPVPAGSTAAAATTTYTYDAFGNLTRTAAPLGRVTSSTYDASGNKTSDTDARGNVTNYKYDALNRLIETDYSDGTKKSVDLYDFRNNVVHETDQNGNVTYHLYDLAGRQIAVTQAYGTANATTTTYAYDNAGRMISETDALGHATTYTYDAAGNLLSTTGVGGSFTFTYDNAGNQVSMTDGNGNTTHYAYDARRRLTVTTYPDTRTKTNSFDGLGNLISVTDQAGNQVQYTYDAANQLINVVQVSSPNTDANTTIYGYDANGNPIALEDANTHTTTNAFDLLSELTSKLLPDGTHSETRTYDSNGNLASVTHFNGTTTTYTYDPLNRLLSRSTPGEVTVSHTYTATGQYASTTDASGNTTYAYDKMDRITAKITPEGTLNYTYDAAGHVASISSSNVNGASMSYTYDDLNRLSTVTDNRTGGVTTYNYDNASNVATVTYPNGVQSTFTYDTLNRVAGLSSQPASYTYQRGPTGNLLSASESSGRQVSWNYDGIYRLTNETISLAPSHNNGSVTYGLDPVGNRDSVASGLGGVSSGTWSFNADDELASETYDANGNVTATGGKTFTYNSQNQMTSMTANGTTATIIYDAFGERVSKTVSGVTTQYLVEDDKNPTGLPQVFDELTNGVVARTYTYGLQRIDEEQIVNGSWTPSYYGFDGGGNVRNLTDSAGAVTDEYEYDAFGNMFKVSGTTPNNYLYRGEQYDPDLGLYYLRARYYNPTTGRFMSRDPKDGKLTDPKSLHKYLYADGDPVNRRDPLGREALIEYAFMTIGKPVGECLLQDEDSIGACLVDKAKDAAQEYWLGRIPNPGAGSAWAFGKQMGGCVIAAYTGIANVLNTIIEGGTVDQTVADQVGENLEECAYETVKEELGTVITTMLVPNPPE